MLGVYLSGRLSGGHINPAVTVALAARGDFPWARVAPYCLAQVAGAFVAGSRALVQWLVNSARTYIFTTAHPPAQAAAVMASLQLMRDEPWRRERIQQHIVTLAAFMQDKSLHLRSSRSPIQAIIIGSNEAAVSYSMALREQGVWIPAIRPPTVPAGTARLRVSLTAGHTEDDIKALLAALDQAIG